MNKLLSLALILFLTNIIYCDDISDLEKKWDYKFQQLQDHFSRNISMIINELEQLKKDTKPANNSENTCGSDWVAYEETKCFRVTQDKGSEDEAKASCAKLDSSATLITIGSKDEQQFISDLLKDSTAVSEFVWIGLEYKDKAFKWLDGSAPQYQNWDENAIKDGSNQCVQMSLSKTNLGKWTDDSCKKKYLVACQKKASTKEVLAEEVNKLAKSVADLKNVSDSQEKVVEDQGKQLKALGTGSSVPIGFIYTQLPGQSEPADLWHSYEWKDVTADYAGMFFRALGGTSEKFGVAQQASQSGIDSFRVSSDLGAGISFYKYDPIDFKLKSTGWSGGQANDQQELASINAIWFHKTEGENYPKNMAIKFWKRVN